MLCITPSSYVLLYLVLQTLTQRTTDPEIKEEIQEWFQGAQDWKTGKKGEKYLRWVGTKNAEMGTRTSIAKNSSIFDHLQCTLVRNHIISFS